MVLVESAVAGASPNTPPQKRRNTSVKNSTVVGKVECITAGRTYHALDLDGCRPTSLFWIIVNDDASGTDLNV